MAADAPVRTCIACGKSDSDPKHGVVVAPDLIAFHHIECGALMEPICGTPDADIRTCPGQLEGWDGTRGDGLRDHIMSTKETV